MLLAIGVPHYFPGSCTRGKEGVRWVYLILLSRTTTYDLVKRKQIADGFLRVMVHFDQDVIVSNVK